TALIGQTLTLPGIAGFLLSIGMAVDANIIIYERIKDELRHGKTLHAAIDAGFKRAFVAIFDANVTTLIAALVLMYFGTGPIKGFAVTLSIGILASMFTALTFTHWMLRWCADVWKKTALYGVKEG
ncbi:MAG: efflux RND transporter permease subunit, partial [Methylocystaceae bacterium]